MLKVNDLSFAYDQNPELLKEISFSVKKGEHLCIMGESGSGKSTLLKLIYGLLDADKGSMAWNDIPILGPAYNLVPGMKFAKYVAQDFDLMPFTSISENISKFLSRTDPEETEKRTLELLDLIDLTERADQKVKTLSGGEKQRVAIARALAKEPELFLLDEPFSQIDNFRKNDLRRGLFGHLKKKGISCIVATHDADDALSFADRLIVIHRGRIIANGSPEEVYRDPGSKYVASFFDDINEVLSKDKRALLYPSQIRIVKKSDEPARVLDAFFKGDHWLVQVAWNDQILYLNHFTKPKISQKVFLEFADASNDS